MSSITLALTMNNFELPGPEKTLPRLSNRSKGSQASAAFIEKFEDLLNKQYSSQNVNGLINFGVAENTLMQAELKEYFNSHLDLQDLDFTYGDSCAGSKRLFDAVIRLLDRHFKPLKPVLHEHLICGAGQSAILDQLTHMLCDEGEGILVANPFYSGFINDISCRAGCHLIGIDVGTEDPSSPSTLAAFDAYMSSSPFIRPRAVILCNPNNPLGFNYPRATLLAYCEFVERWNLHLLCDEIYALSQFANKEKERAGTKRDFVSMLNVDVRRETGCDPARVHVLYGMSKDFGANGLRLGVFVTQHNPQLRKTLLGTSLLMKVSSPSDALWSALLNDDQMLERVVTTNQIRLGKTLQHCQDFFSKHNVPIIQPEAAHFIFIDLRSYLRQTDDSGKKLATPAEQETDLFYSFIRNGVYVASGSSYGYPIPGWFRFTFCVRRDYLDLGFDRIAKTLDSRKQQ
ncbi:PLP-dependent transferase [Neolentinus lepideus HHB14362 ss-1]|uniref:PLP-dependent transferase n=1 Tax=Neolentinus lepideus HHB14362 ss-1 TaxID=1314782 RepID=A0A165TPY5_9AGAM|nr:PLP-dependent transferase [Neolentinus lepideus HHB14362 ss-1]